jgi:molybdopterin converting factor small subunit
MKVNLYSTFREHAGIAHFELELQPGATAGWAIGELLKRYPALEKLWLDAKGDLHGHVHVCINQVDIHSLPKGLDTIVEPQDTLDIFPPVTGGQENSGSRLALTLSGLHWSSD